MVLGLGLGFRCSYIFSNELAQLVEWSFETPDWMKNMLLFWLLIHDLATDRPMIHCITIKIKHKKKARSKMEYAKLTRPVAVARANTHRQLPDMESGPNPKITIEV